MLDYVLVVPTEPLARLATTTPHDRLIDSTTVAVTNFALWRVHAFNQLVEHLAHLLTENATEITSADTSQARREELAAAAMSLSLFVHLDGIGGAWANFPDGSRGCTGRSWNKFSQNMGTLEDAQKASRRRWLREWPYVLFDVVALLGVVVVTATVATHELQKRTQHPHQPATTTTSTTPQR